MLPGFVDRGPVVGADEIAAFEERCGYRLPADYRAFLLAQNGGARSLPAHMEDDATENWTQRMVRTPRFYSLGAAAAAGFTVAEALEQLSLIGHFEDWMELEAEFPGLLHDLDVKMHICRGDGSHGYYPPELLPIGTGGYENLLLLRVDGPDAGAVFSTWDPDGYCEWHCDREAGSFVEYLQQLNEPPPSGNDP